MGPVALHIQGLHWVIFDRPARRSQGHQRRLLPPIAAVLPIDGCWSVSARNGLMHRSNAIFRGRDASYLAPPAQIRTCGFPAYGSHLGYRRQFGAVDEPTSCATLTRLGVRRVLSWRAFP